MQGVVHFGGSYVDWYHRWVVVFEEGEVLFEEGALKLDE